MAGKASKIKAKAAARVAQNKEEAIAHIKLIGDHQRQRQRIKAEMDDQINAIQERYAAQLKPLDDEIKSLSAGVHTWAEANRDELTHSGKTKTANLITGELRWRVTPPSCKLVRVKEAIEELKQKMLNRFIRTKEEVNKEAILSDPSAVTGCAWITIEQTEEFVIVPYETELEEVA